MTQMQMIKNLELPGFCFEYWITCALFLFPISDLLVAVGRI